MTILTENVVLVRTRAQDLKSVRKLNCWGSELTDISVVRRMSNVEILSLSVNNISTLSDFAHCPHLQELYIRKNNIRDLNELCYLQDLRRLLWIADNPCTHCDKYRFTVLRALPSLEKLDNIAVQPEEVDQAKVHGLLLNHPLECSSDSVDLGSTVISVAKAVESNKIVEIEHEDRDHIRNNVNNANVDEDKSNYYNDRNGEVEKEATNSKSSIKNSPSINSLVIENYDNQQIHFVKEQTINSHHGVEVPCHPSPHHAFQARVKTLVDHSGKRTQPIINTQSSPTSNFIANDHHYSRASSRHSQISQSDSELDGTASIGDGYRPYDPENIESGKGYRNSPYQSPGFVALQRSDKSSSSPRLLPKGGKNRNSNILSAVLCLIKELDYASLEVVETVIHCRMEEMED